MILITGKSTLAEALSKNFNDCIIIGKPEYNFNNKEDCDRLFADYSSPDILINTFATLADDPWNSLLTNFVAPVYITNQYYNNLTKGQIINISSTSAWWSSYPNIPENRFYYNLSKFNLSEFGRQFNRSIVDKNKEIILTTVEIGKFESKLSNFNGTDIDKIVKTIECAIEHKLNWISAIK